MTYNKRIRLIFELPQEVIMAIKLRAIKTDSTTGHIVC
jgi:hypothetical protein